MARNIIFHIDMDAFFASVEQLDNPYLRGKCVVVGGKSQRGVVAAASYEARKYGVHSAMPIFKAKQKCPGLVIVSPRRKRYVELSKKIMALLKEVSPMVEPISIDEAFVDITGCQRLHGTPQVLARAIKNDIFNKVGLTCSIGVAPNKFLAKIASDLHKPDGLSVIPPTQMQAFIDTLAVEKVPGVGFRAKKILLSLGIQTLGQVRQYPETVIIKKLGKFGHRLIELSCGEDRSQVTTHHDTKSISTETTLFKDTTDQKLLKDYLLSQSQSVAHQLRIKQLRCRTIVLKIKTSDFKLYSRSRTLCQPIQSAQQIYQVVLDLLDQFSVSKAVRLIGVGVGGVQPVCAPVQAKLFPDRQQALNQKWEKVDRVIDALAERFGDRTVTRGKFGRSKDKNDALEKNKQD